MLFRGDWDLFCVLPANPTKLDTIIIILATSEAPLFCSIWIRIVGTKKDIVFNLASVFELSLNFF